MVRAPPHRTPMRECGARHTLDCARTLCETSASEVLEIRGSRRLLHRRWPGFGRSRKASRPRLADVPRKTGHQSGTHAGRAPLLKEGWKESENIGADSVCFNPPPSGAPPGNLRPGVVSRHGCTAASRSGRPYRGEGRRRVLLAGGAHAPHGGAEQSRAAGPARCRRLLTCRHGSDVKPADAGLRRGPCGIRALSAAGLPGLQSACGAGDPGSRSAQPRSVPGSRAGGGSG